MSWGIIFFALMAIVGAAVLITGQNMKSSGKITVGWFIGQDIKADRCRDVPGFIDAVYPKTMQFGSVAVVLSVILILVEAFEISALFEIVLLLIIIVFYISFTRTLRKATDKYLR